MFLIRLVVMFEQRERVTIGRRQELEGTLMRVGDILFFTWGMVSRVFTV